MSTALTDVLSTPKFLLCIVSLSTREDNASNLLVNKAWAEEVLNVEWRDVDQVQWLLGLLAPFEEIEPPEDAEHDLCTLKFVRSPESSDWDRFHRYAARVKYLIHEWNMFDPSVYATLSRYQDQTRTIFFPNLRHLCCLIDTGSLGVFLRPGLRSLTLCYDSDRHCIDHRCLQSSLSLLTQIVAPSLTDLIFNYHPGDDPLKASEDLLVSALREMKRLRSLDIPPHWLSERVTQALAALPSLRELEAYSYPHRVNTTEIITTLSTSLNSDSFPFLVDLSLTIPFERAGASFTSWDDFEPPNEYKSMIAVIVETFPSLRKLSIHVDSKDLPPNIPAPRLTFQALKPILRLQDLDTLQLSYTTPLYLTEADLSKIFWELESITLLELNPTPPIQTPSSLHLTCLMAAHLAGSRIQSLRLYVDTSLKGFEYAMDLMERLELFDSLDVGYSVLSRESMRLVVEYLSLALPEECKIEAQMPGERQYHASPEWKKVISSVPAFTQATRLGDIGEVHRLRIALSQ